MKLFINDGSPFARKVRIVVRETGLLPQTEEIFVVPVESPPALISANPVAQIPALVDGDDAWYDSTLICAWLDSRTGGRLTVEGTDGYWRMRRVEAAATAMLEMTVKMVLENRRPESERSPFWLKRWEDGLMRGFKAAEAMCPTPDSFDLGSLTLAIAATYTEFRYPHIDWRQIAPRIAALQAELEKRQSFIDTYPK